MQEQIDSAKNIIADYYKSKKPLKKKVIDFEIKAITNLNSGLGDTLSISNLPFAALKQGKNIQIHSPSPHFNSLVEFNPYYAPADLTQQFHRAEILQGEYDCGPGHFIQKLQRACKLEPDKIPKPMVIRAAPFIKSYVALCFSVGQHAANQKHIHPRARELYDEHKKTIQEFINDNLHKYHFFEIGTEFTGFENVDDKCNLSLRESILELNKAEYFFGMHSGVMHLAAGLDIKSIVLLNFPEPKDLILPYLKDIGVIDMDWLEPQNIYLHLDSDGPLVKKMNRENLEKAFEGQVYPYFKAEEFCDLV